VLLGPSGCAKIITMGMIAGLQDATDGDIVIDGKRVDDLDPKDRDVAMVFRSCGLYPHLNVHENIRFPLKVRKVDPATHDERVRRASAMVELDEFLHRKPAELSGGQRQRVTLARAIVREPDMFVMDEPLSNLDAKLRVSTRARIKTFSHELKVTTDYVTHDQIEAMTLADGVVMMKQGKVQQVGTPTEICDRPANTFVASFIGSPAMNLMDGRMAGGTFTCDRVTIAVMDVPDGPVTKGFRAEDAALAEADGQITSTIYTIELLRDATMLTVRAGGQLVSVKAHKEYRAEIGDTVSFSAPNTIRNAFDSTSGDRLDRSKPPAPSHPCRTRARSVCWTIWWPDTVRLCNPTSTTARPWRSP